MTRRSTRIVPLLLAALLLAGCAAPGASGTSGGDDGGTSPGTGSGDTGERPTEIPPGLIECDTSDKDAVMLPASVANVEYDVPSGFDEVGGYTQVQPAEGDYTATYLGFVGAAGAEVIAIVHYGHLANGPVSDACGALDLDAVLERLAEHSRLSGSDVTAKPELQEAGGLPVVVEERTYSDQDFALWHYWFYGRDDLLNVSCQWTSHQDEIMTGCEALIDSLRFG